MITGISYRCGKGEHAKCQALGCVCECHAAEIRAAGNMLSSEREDEAFEVWWNSPSNDERRKSRHVSAYKGAARAAWYARTRIDAQREK